MSDRTEVPLRAGEVLLQGDLTLEQDARLCFIGHARTPWGPDNCPKNISGARATGQGARIEMAEGFAEGLKGLEPGQPVIVIYWMNRARRDLMVQAPRHIEGTRGTFALRSPHRPNPLAMAAATITEIDHGSGAVMIDALDCFDGTPVVDIKPWVPTIDMPADSGKSA